MSEGRAASFSAEQKPRKKENKIFILGSVFFFHKVETRRQNVGGFLRFMWLFRRVLALWCRVTVGIRTRREPRLFGAFGLIVLARC